MQQDGSLVTPGQIQVQLSPPADPIDQLQKLGQLRDAGILTEEEFQAKKSEILSRM